MIMMKCEKGHYTDHFLLYKGQPMCPICGCKTYQQKLTELSKPKKWKPRALKKPWVKPQELF